MHRHILWTTLRASKRPKSCPNRVQVHVCGACCSTTTPAVTPETQVAGTLCLSTFGSPVAGPFPRSGRSKSRRCCKSDRKLSKVMNCLRFSSFGAKSGLARARPGQARPAQGRPGQARSAQAMPLAPKGQNRRQFITFDDFWSFSQHLQRFERPDSKNEPATELPNTHRHIVPAT